MRYKIIFLFVLIYSAPLNAEIGPDGTGTVRGYFIGPGVDLSGSPPVTWVSGYYHNMVLMEEGNCLAWGWNNYGQANIDSDLNGIVSIDGGYYHSVAVTEEGSVFAWGRNNYGQITIPDDLGAAIAVAA